MIGTAVPGCRQAKQDQKFVETLANKPAACILHVEMYDQYTRGSRPGAAIIVVGLREGPYPCEGGCAGQSARGERSCVAAIGPLGTAYVIHAEAQPTGMIR